MTIPTATCLTKNSALLSQIRDLSPVEWGQATSAVRAHLGRLRFQEVVLSPFDAHPIDYRDGTIDVPGVGQLRFNTEPEIWQAYQTCSRFFSISHLFRMETQLNLLRRSNFHILDFYQPGPPDALLPVFQSLLESLAEAGLVDGLADLTIDYAEYDPERDEPRISLSAPRWVVARGYDAAHSFFEVAANGESTRQEIFLVTPSGFLEIAGMGITGMNQNPRYSMRRGPDSVPPPPRNTSGMGIGLERLLLADQLLPT